MPKFRLRPSPFLSVAVILPAHSSSLSATIQGETENKEEHNRFWLLHSAMFRLAHGQITSGEIVDPTSGMRTTNRLMSSLT